MEVQGVTNNPGVVLGAQSTDPNDLDKVDFLNLLIAQIKHQDPLSPMDNQEFISQLTQFTNIDQLTAINDKLEDSMTLTQSLNNTMMLELVGKNVTVLGDNVELGGGVASTSHLQVASAGQATVRVIDAYGQEVASFTVPVTAGLNEFTWDGKTADGDPAPDGRYSLRVSVTDEAGNDVASSLYMSGPVESLRFVNNVGVVGVAGQEFTVAEILEINN
jgi:flagellar basal-body rod modification protein FlgD